MYRLKISGNFFLILNDSDSTEHSRHPSKDVRYQIYNELDVDPTISIFGLEGQFNTKSNEEDKFLSSVLLDENGVSFSSLNVLYDFLDKNTGGKKLSDSGNIVVDLATNDLGRTAWGYPLFSQERSLFHGMFTYNVPVDKWYETFNGSVLENTFNNATSVNGKLNLTSGNTLNDVTYLRSFRNPRYQPNRGHKYVNSVFMPNPDDNGKRDFGFFTAESGCFFRLKQNSELYAVVRTTINSVTTDDERLIPNTESIDFSQGHLFDCQMQWRGVGSYAFFFDLKLVFEIDYLKEGRTELTMFNPANPLAFECENLGDEVVLQCGCVDISTQGGNTNGNTYGSVNISNDSGQVGISGFNQPIIAIRSKLTVNGLINTRDTLSLLASAYGDQRCVFRVWATRDFTAITENDQVWKDYGDGHLEYIEYNNPVVGAAMSFETTKANLIFGSRVDQDKTYATSALFEGRTEIYQTPGDMFVFTMHRETGQAANVGVTYEFGQAI